MKHILTLQGEHGDGSDCDHNTYPSGRAREAGCTGRARYVGSCSCGWTGHAATKNYLAQMHRDTLRGHR